MSVIVFDLDDTLYLERDYLLSGVAALSLWVAGRFGVEGFGDTARRLLGDGTHPRLFDAALEMMGIVPTPAIIAEMIGRYRAHEPRLSLAPDAARLLARLRGLPLALVTDGHLAVQRAKVDALGLVSHGFDPIICTDQWGRDSWKPHPRAFEMIAARWPGERIAYIADNPAKDFVAPRSLGWCTVQIDRPGSIHGREASADTHRADCRIDNFDRLGDDPVAAIFGGRGADAGIAA